MFTYQFTKHGNESQVRSANLAAVPLVPHLEPKLVVDDVSDGQFTFHFELKNIGKLRARNISYLYSMSNGLTLGSEADAKHPRDLATDSMMSLRPEDRRQRLPHEGAPLRVFLVLNYSADLEGKETWHRRKMSFAIYRDAKVGPLPMEEGSDREEKVGLTQEVNALGKQLPLDGPQGSASIDFAVGDQNRDQDTVFFSSNLLALVLNPATNTMAFQIRMNGDSSVLQVECPLREPSLERHHVSISWDQFGAALRCDGVEYNGSRLPR